ncbi:MAG: heme exporter protein CcmD [Candidatus Macondimonas sp.]|jgi:heme exporter protein D
MNMRIAEFFAMGGYAPYVWGSYGLALAVLVYNAWVPVRRHRRLRLSIQAETRTASRHPAAPTHRISDENGA